MPPEPTGKRVWHVWVSLDLLFPARTCERQTQSPGYPGTHRRSQSHLLNAQPLLKVSSFSATIQSLQIRESWMLTAITRHITKRKALGIPASHTLISLIIVVSIPIPVHILSDCGPCAPRFKITGVLHDAAHICHQLLHEKGEGTTAGSREINSHFSATAPPFTCGMDLFLPQSCLGLWFGSKRKGVRPTPFLGTGTML